MRTKSIPKRKIPTITFDKIRADFDDLLRDIPRDLSLLLQLQTYHQRFNAIFFNQELSGTVLLSFWDDMTLGYDQMSMIKKRSVFTRDSLELQDLEEMLIVYEPPLYCFCTPQPFKHLNKQTIDRKMDYFRQGIEKLFGIKTKPIFYPF